MKKICLYLVLVSLAACSQPMIDAPMTTVFSGGTIYSGQGEQRLEALAVREGVIVAAGSIDSVLEAAGDNPSHVDLKGRVLMPGFIESHGHLTGFGHSQQILALSDVTSYQELVAVVAEAVAEAQPGQWIVGRGWHQSKWTSLGDKVVKGFQTHHALSAVSPDNPVLLAHASGHAVFANEAAMALADVGQGASFGGDGEIILDEEGMPTGIFNENAANLISDLVPADSLEDRKQQIRLATKAALAKGVTSFHDAGSDPLDMQALLDMAASGELGLRVYAILSTAFPALIDDWFAKGPMVDAYDGMLSVRSVKIHADGALGSRGAWLLEQYSDRHGHYGMPTYPMEGVEEMAVRGLNAGFQVNVHAIGDRTNQEVMDRFAAALEQAPNADHRFRIEHAQHLALSDIPRFAQLGVIASMQAIHMSSDRPWAIDRLGIERIEEGAYVWQKLLQSGAVVVNGTDVPIEPIDPFACFYASVTRKTLAGQPEGGYEASQRMTRAQALISYTRDAAYAAFQEKHLGTLEQGKWADMVILDRDIMQVDESAILDTQVLATLLAGKVVYGAL
jgi:predicted amidohydrolase YtcJ